MTRQSVVDAAIAEIGPDTHEKRIKYWESALGYEIHYYEEIAKMAWCGGFTLAMLHEAGLARDVHWKVGAGFLLRGPHPLSKVDVPEPGDIGYQHVPFQHHFIVESVDGNVVHSIDGNQPDVRRQARPISSKLAFYSIAPFLGQQPLPSPKKWVQPEDVQRALNAYILQHSLDAHAPGDLLKVDGIIGAKSVAALKWFQAGIGISVTGNPDHATCVALGLSK